MPRHLWLILSAIAALVGVATGAPLTFLVGATGLLWLPVLAAYLPGNWAKESDNFQVVGWTLIAVVALALSGGVRSPLTILFALGPLTGLALARRKIAIEAGVFSAVAFFAFWALNFWFRPPPVPENYLGFTTALTLAAIIYAGILAAASIVNLRRRIAGELSAERTVRETGASLELRGGVHLPADVAYAVVSVTPHGRIRAIEGDRSLTGPLRVGRDAQKVLSSLHPALGEAVRLGDGEMALELDDIGPVLVRHRQLESGPVIVIERPGDDTDGIRAALEERTAFFASLGHDLKTPLNAIIGFADMMRSEIRGELPEAYREYSEIIHESGNDMLLMVDDMLDLAKADSRKLRLDFEPVDLGTSAVSVCRQMAAQADRAGVSLELDVEDEVWAHADARAVRQIWQNLVSNAIKYSADGDKVILSAGETGGGVALSVEDFGAGMDEADLDRVAAPFSQGRNARGRVGTGLGLAVVKTFADLQNGRVRIDTAAGVGTRVEVWLPPADVSGLEDMEKAAQ